MTDGLWAIVEIMGRRTRAGMISDAQLGGATLLRIEHPTVADHGGEDPLTEYYAPAAVFAIRPCSHADAVAVAAWAWPGPRSLKPELAPVFDIDDDDDFRDGDI
jgi:hypothetical protein